jgi:hypothetical protein
MTMDVFECLKAADRRLAEEFGPLRSLAPGRKEATPLATVFDRLGPLPGPVKEALATGLADIVEAQAENFPDTIFWDVDAMATCIADGPAAADPEKMSHLCSEISALQAQYGRHSVLAFRYTHDFTYGFDWAKWVRRGDPERAETGPFHPDFIAYLRRRGAELVELIKNNDEKYPKLPNGKPRNPFGFHREPEHEVRLFADLAERDLVPLRGWEARARARYDRPFGDLRTERAKALQIPTKPVGGA